MSNRNRSTDIDRTSGYRLRKGIRLHQILFPKYRPEEYSKEAIAALMPAVKRREQDAINRVILLLARMAIKLARKDEELQLQALEKLCEVVKMIAERPQEEKDPRTFIIVSIQLHLVKRRVRNNLFHVSPAYWKKSGKEFSKKYFDYEQKTLGAEQKGLLKRKGRKEFMRDAITLAVLPEPDWSFTEETIAGMSQRMREVVGLRMSGMDDVEVAGRLGLTKARVGQIRKEAQDYARKRFEDHGMGEIVRGFEKQSAQSRGLPDDGGRFHDKVDVEAGGGS